MSRRCLSWLLLTILSCHSIQATLLYPAASVLQITTSIAVPIEIPNRKLYWDWGFQMNYDLPFNLERLYNAPIWPGTVDQRVRRSVENENKNNVSLWYEADLKYNSASKEIGKHPSDFTAGELYHSLENLLVNYGFHESCLLRSVCELAHHPFSDDQQNVVTDILTFILTPSLHKAFSPLENLYREVYEESETRGFLQYNCTELYNDCKQDLLTSITLVLTDSKRDNN